MTFSFWWKAAYLPECECHLICISFMWFLIMNTFLFSNSVVPTGILDHNVVWCILILLSLQAHCFYWHFNTHILQGLGGLISLGWINWCYQSVVLICLSQVLHKGVNTASGSGVACQGKHRMLEGLIVGDQLFQAVLFLLGCSSNGGKLMFK